MCIRDRRYGWLASSSLRAWAAVKAEQPDHDGALDYEKILARQRAQEQEEES